eukprot:CAMPEP_0169431398 /NCGR_PEP_ID=MMETSP1042-20121227/2924_1 /TAXON_ID=464988 /ORGANISM="Hemiselmis andersenii, Strain CCMP1180" /LENGTH=246 /DNA_ID=CAMNT_0009541803 /DNA_START=144 /DNA_END=881 /DNA_ORIENTATION=-
MVVMVEFRIPMPLTTEEYRIGNLFTTAKTTKLEAQRSEGAGIEVIKNEPCNHPKYGPGQYTLKKYYIHDKLPGWLRTILPKANAVLVEESYNCFPYVRTELTIELFKKFKMTVETQLREGPAGTEDNALQIPPRLLKKRQVEVIDIVESKLPKDSAAKYGEFDPTTSRCGRAARGPLKKGWRKTQVKQHTHKHTHVQVKPIMCAYKLVTADFDYFGLKSKVETFMIGYERDLFLSTHRQMFCWMDE